MEWKIMSKTDALSVTSSWQQMNKEAFDKMVVEWADKIDKDLPEEYKTLRKEILEANDRSKRKVRDNKDYSKKKDYFTDLFFAIELYSILDKYGFSIRMASNDQVWIYLCVVVFPDIVHARYPGIKTKINGEYIERNINEERFWKTRRRIYLKVLWWYVYLSLQVDQNGSFDREKTIQVLENNTTDEIVQIVERSGEAGYRADVYREIMRYYSENRKKYDNEVFRRVMVLNTAKTRIVEPRLIDGGVSEYVKELFDFVC